jgi:hypothetical protein
LRLSRTLTAVIAVVTLGIILAGGYVFAMPRGPVIAEASVGSAVITPNADKRSDAATIRYRIRREAEVSIYFEDEQGQRYYFRRSESRASGEYEVLFSGVVEPYQADGDNLKAELIQRLIPDGTYTWVVEAADESGSSDRRTGTLEVAEADTTLPDIWEFTVQPLIFTPNQDGIDDRLWINVSVPKDAEILVYLIDENGERIFIPEFQSERPSNVSGRHSFEYDGGIDNGSDPPPDGIYQVVVEARDDEGQRLQAFSEMTIRNGGVPLAEILAQPVGDTVRFSSVTVLEGDVLEFELTVENYGDAPIRTTGPASGYIYDQHEVFGNTEFYQESGAWRIGIDCDTCLRDFPWRWALGTLDELTAIETNGVTHYYLMPDQRVIVRGGIRLTDIVASRNPQQFWAGLIHEDVGIAPLNNFVDPHWIEIVSGALTGEGSTAP